MIANFDDFLNTVEQKLSRIDLNLLVSLSTLLKEQSVSKAAERLYLSQSAMSRTLQRLRDLFDDPLFYRTATGIVPTVKAQTIEALLPDLLQSLNNILTHQNFDPQQCQQHFSLSIPSLMSHAFLLPLLAQVSKDAPLVKITEHSAKADPYKYLESGYFDFSIHVEKPVDTSFNATFIGSVAPVIFARKNHPLAKKSNVNLADCFAYNFLDLNIESNGGIHFANPVDSMLIKKGFSRNIQLASSQFSIVIEVLKTSDNLLIGPHFLMNSNRNDDFAIIHQFEQSKHNVIDLYLIEHKRVENSAAHQWFKELILNQTL